MFQSDRWLSEVMERPVWRVLPDKPDIDLLSVAGRRTAFFYTRVPTSRVAHVGQLMQAGFRVVDVNITLERAPAHASSKHNFRDIQVVDYKPEYETAVLQIAGSCFVYSRFHLDPHVGHDLANMIKRAWVQNCCRGKRGDHLFIATMANRPVGFLAALATRVDDQACCVIDLVGVAPEAQGRGVGRALVEAFLCHYAGRCDRFRVGTQAANIRSLRLYEKVGFQICQTDYVLHAHCREGTIVT